MPSSSLSETEIKSLADRYPFSNAELGLLIDCFRHDEHSAQSQEEFPWTLAATEHDDGKRRRLVDRLRRRQILPHDFWRRLHHAIVTVNEGYGGVTASNDSADLEWFLEGMAVALGRRGARECLSVMWRTAKSMGDDDDHDEGNGNENNNLLTAKRALDMGLRLAIAVSVCNEMERRNDSDRGDDNDDDEDDDDASQQSLIQDLEPAIDCLLGSLGSGEGLAPNNSTTIITETTFARWAEARLPLLPATLSTLLHALLLHPQPHPTHRVPYVPPWLPKVQNGVDILASKPPRVDALAFSLLLHRLGGEWKRIYCMDTDGGSFNRLEWALLGYAGPTLLLVRTTRGAVLGAFAGSPWRESRTFHGDSVCFLFQLAPRMAVYMPLQRLDNDSSGVGISSVCENYLYLHSRDGSPHTGGGCPLAHGLGLGGTVERPRLFIPETLEHCRASSLDKTFDPGSLLPDDALETFEILDLEVWGVGGDDCIAAALAAREEHRGRAQSLLREARTVRDKSQFARDLSSGLYCGSKTFAHQENVRGRAAFDVDDVHGGYRLDHDKDE